MSAVPRATTIAVLAAQAEEIAPLLARLAARRDGRDAASAYWSGRCGGVDVSIAVCGVGRRRAQAAAGTLLERSAASRLLVVGVAGALTANLGVGTLVVGDRLATEAGESALPDATATRLAVERGARPATVVTVDRMVSTVAERQALLRALESPAAAVVDMESWDAVAAAGARGVPATVLRVVSDDAGDALPAFLERCRKPDGDVDRRRVALHAIVRPASIPTLLELRRRIRLGAEVLAEAVPSLLVCLVDG